MHSQNTSCSLVSFKSSNKIQNHELKREQENLLGSHAPNPNENINEHIPLMLFMKTNQTSPSSPPVFISLFVYLNTQYIYICIQGVLCLQFWYLFIIFDPVYGGFVLFFVWLVVVFKFFISFWFYSQITVPGNVSHVPYVC